MDTGPSGGENSDEDSASLFCDLIAMGISHFPDQSVGPQHSEFAADA